MQAVALEHRMGRVILPSCHGAWTLGGVIGAVLTLATTDVPWSAIGSTTSPRPRPRAVPPTREKGTSLPSSAAIRSRSSSSDR